MPLADSLNSSRNDDICFIDDADSGREVTNLGVKRIHAS